MKTSSMTMIQALRSAMDVMLERDDNVAKFWLRPVRLENNDGFRRNEINRIYRVIEDNLSELLRGWDEQCSD